MTIDGGSNVTISGNDVTRLFLVNSTATAVNIDNLTITHGLARGDVGRRRRPGGAIYNSGTLTLNNDTISASVAQGGAGNNEVAGAAGATANGGNGGAGVGRLERR